MKKTLIVGASTTHARYSYLVANKLAREGCPIGNVGRKVGEVAGGAIEKPEQIHDDIDTITVYIGPQNQEPYMDYIEKTKPKRVIFNPGAENAAFAERLRSQGIDTIEACTLVMLNTGQY